MPNNTELLQMPLTLWAYLNQCNALPVNAPACVPLWTLVAYGCMALGAFVLIWSVWQLISYRLKLAAALKAQAERERVADPETMNKHKWSEAGDSADVTDPHLAEKIRAELDQRRLKALTGHK